VLKKLDSLEITRSKLGVVQLMLDPKVLPSLRHLAFIDIRQDFSLNALSDTPFLELLLILESFCLINPPTLPLPAYFIPAFSHTRFDCDYDDLEMLSSLREGVQHIQLTGLDQQREDHQVDDLSRVVSYIQNSNPLRLRSICLSRRFWLKRSSMPAQRAVLQAFTTVCEGRNIEVYQEEARSMVHQSHISEKFAEVLGQIRAKDEKERDKVRTQG